MKTNAVIKTLAASAVALSLAVLPASAQTGSTGAGTDGTGTTTTQPTYDNNDDNGYWGLLGLLGLFGLLGRRSKQDDVATAYRDPSATETMGSRRP